MKIFFAIFSFIILTALLGTTAFAIGEVSPKLIPDGPTSGGALLGLFDDIINWIFVLVMMGSVLFIVLAGWQFISAGGDANAVAEARKKLLLGVIGIAIAVMARGIPVVVEKILEV